MVAHQTGRGTHPAAKASQEPAVRPPKTVAPTPLEPSEARTRTNEARDDDRMDPPWCMVGYVAAYGALGFHPIWAVWWDPETDRVWLKADGH